MTNAGEIGGRPTRLRRVMPRFSGSLISAVAWAARPEAFTPTWEADGFGC